jgi:tetratricopeptide (TPR) repeat protein
VISALELEVDRIRELTRRRRYVEALAAAEALEVAAPENIDALYLVAANQRCLHRIPEALATLERLELRHPRLGRLFQERGHCYMTLRDAPRATEAFLRAVSIDPTLTASWSTLERIRGYLVNAGERVEAARLRARITHHRAAFDEAEKLFEALLELAPDHRAARLDYARLLMDRQKYPEARQELDTLLQLESGNMNFLTVSAELHLLVAHSAKTVGHQREAIESYRAAAVARPAFGDAYWSLANLKTYRFSQDELANMQAHEAEADAAVAATTVDRYHLCFALGKALEDRRDYAQSWQYYERGNALKRAESRYRPEIIETNTRRQIEVCTAEFFAAHAGAGAPDRDPIFIVGLPRSGSTLIEQILASHSQVEGTRELPEIQHMVLELQGRDPDPNDPRYPGVLQNLALEDFRRLGERYLNDTRAHREGASNTPAIQSPRPFFIDKMPNNFRHLGLLRLMLPNAKIIDARREPMACGFSNWKQLFASGQEFSYTLEDIARYYRTYLDLMRHWDEVLPGWVLRVEYEDLVEDLEGHVRRILGFCDLEFEPACLEFYKTGRSVRTASSEQVRQPLFREGLTQWQHYEPWLGPLRSALGDALLRYRDT